MSEQTTNYNDTNPAAPTNGVNVKWQADAVSADPTVVRKASAYVPLTGVLFSKTVTFATGVLAAGASEQATVVLAAAGSATVLSVSANCRVRLYATSAKATADAARLATVPPTAGVAHGCCMDVVLDGTTGLTNWLMSPEAAFSNQESSRANSITYIVTNNTGGSVAITVTLTFKVREVL